MKEIRVLYQQLSVPQVEHLLRMANGSVREQTYFARFFDLLGTHSEYDDDQMATALYGEGKDHRYKPYQKLKYKFKYLLLNLFLLMDGMQPDYTSREKAVKTIFREYTAARLLATKKNSADLAVKVYERVYKRAVEFEVNSVAYDTARDLVLLFGGIVKQPKKGAYYQDAYKRYKKLIEAEDVLRDLYVEVLASFRHKKTEVLISYLSDKLGIIEGYLQDFNSSRILYLGGLCMVTYYELVGDAESMLQQATRVVDRLSEKKNTSINPDSILTFQLYVSQAYAMSGAFDQAIVENDQIIKQLKPSDHNYVHAALLGVMYALQLEDFVLSRKKYGQLAVKNIRKYSTTETKELYLLLGGYISLLEEYGLMTGTDETEQTTVFRVGRLKNQIVKIVKSKEDLNCHLYVLEWMFLLIRGKFDDLIMRQEAFSKYVGRYVDQQEQPRLYYFAKLLLLIPDANFHAVRTFHHSSKLYKKLIKHERQKGNYLSLAAEVISFEMLWEMALSVLDGYEHLPTDGMLKNQVFRN